MTVDLINPGSTGFFKYWCQKVLPAVYDDSLSYYELLCKVVNYLNDVIELSNTQSEAITELQELVTQLLETEIEPYIEEVIDAWFEENEPEILNDIEDIQRYIIGSLNFEELSAYARDTNLIDGNRSGAQGFTAFKNSNGDIVSVVYVTYNNSQPGRLRSYLNNTLISDIECSLGHGSSIGYKDGFCYITDNQVTGTIYRASLTQSGVLGSPVAHIPALGGNISVNATTGDVYLIGVNLIRKINISTGTTISSFTPNFHQPDGTLGQSAFAFDFMGKHLFGYLFSNPNCVTIIDEDNNFYGVIYLPNFVDLINMGESENICIDENGEIFIVFNSAASLTSVLRTYTMAHGSIYGGITFTPYDIPSSTYVVIEWYPNSPQYAIPTKDNVAYYGSNAPIKVYYGEDIQSVIDYFRGSVTTISLKEDSESTLNGTHIRDFNGNVNLSTTENNVTTPHHCGQITIDSSSCVLRNTTAQTGQNMNYAIDMRLGCSCILFDEPTDNNSVRIGNSILIIPNSSYKSKIAHSGNYGFVVMG